MATEDHLNTSHHIEPNSDHNGNVPLGTNNLYIPAVDEEKVPIVGTCFETLDDAKEFYKNYGKEGGFSMRFASVKRKQSTGKTAYILLVCSKEGFYVPKEKPTPLGKQRKRKLTREGCNASMRLKLNKSGKWEVTTFVEGHNHELTTPRRTHLIESSRQVTPADKSLLGELKTTNVSTSSCINLPIVQHEGFENIGCTKEDIKNIQSDVEHLLDICKEEQDLDPSFYYAYKVDDDNILTHCFWADGYGREAFGHFNDVVLFNTSYGTDKYKMKFAAFIGMNHHGQPVVFGSGLIHKDNMESYVWLFEKWLEAMRKCVPKAIITDEDPAMEAAIAISFPQTYHRLCMWHIFKKMPKEVAPVFHDDKFQSLIQQCVQKSESSVEFESQWNEIMSTYDLLSQGWLSKKYEIRQKWVPAYSKGIFLGGVRITQLSESIDAFFDKYLKKNNSFVELYAYYQLGLKRLKHDELVKDRDSNYSLPEMETLFSMEEQMAKVFTLDIFTIIQKELCLTLYYVPIPNGKCEDVATYIVKKNGELRPSEVTYNEVTQEGSCSCQMFESEGIPCRHILSVLKIYFVENLPKFFIHRRWTKNAKSSQVFGVDGIELEEDFDVKWAIDSGISQVFSRCLQKASNSSRAQSLLLKGLASIKAQLDMLQLSRTEEVEGFTPKQDVTNLIISSQEKSITRENGKRIIWDNEKIISHANKSQRLCNGCKKRGANHDKRNCPTLKGLHSTQVESQASASIPTQGSSF